jgi:hypothetical protein
MIGVSMTLFLSKSEVDFYRVEITESFQSLLNHPWFSGRRNARQWAFFKHCFAVLMGSTVGDFGCGEKQAVQYKYEISDRLQRYYLGFGRPVKFVFRLVSQKSNSAYEIEEPDYPSCNGYRLMVSYNQDLPDTVQRKKLLLEKTIADAVDSEFEAYKRLPDLELGQLGEFFDRDGSRFKEIANLVRKHKARGWTIGNEMNPSTKRLHDLKIKRMTATRAEVRTFEYWLLMWWSLKDEKYAHTYKEENRQTYRLIWKNEKWLVTDNSWEKPKTSTPRRNIRNR